MSEIVITITRRRKNNYKVIGEKQTIEAMMIKQWVPNNNQMPRGAPYSAKMLLVLVVKINFSWSTFVYNDT